MKAKFLLRFGRAALLIIPLAVFTVLSCTMGGGEEDPTVPSDLKARAQSSTTIYLSWTGIINADKYTVYRISDAGNQQFEVFNACDYTDTGLAPDTLYSYQVSATKGGVEGAKSATVAQKTFPEGTVPVPGQVTGIAAEVSGNGVRVTWGAEGGAGSYTLERGKNSGGPWEEVYTGASTAYSDTGLAAGTWYYRAAASNASGMGPWSAARVAVVGGGSGTDPGVPPLRGSPAILRW